ncbi:hypothetical protein [Novosphingobium sp. KN65.2]|uniref:hypothetical protein n=1 Tax=Novosphingobium sp. KN65.2 TaxID=1478134 RepID=UPI0005E7D372|nr:hypothetical protein [Novosphingobium sp. KN65.2]CDO36330.1 Predicted membrane protein [Novosphingobium sp. KN65.2]
MDERTNVRPPWHFWAAALLSIPWNAFGCLDFTLTVTRSPTYLAQFPPEMIDYVDSFPGWAIVAWALGAWAALLGSVLLVMRSRWTIAAFAASLLGLALTTVYQWTGEAPATVTGAGGLAMTALIWIVAIALLWFAVRMRVRGVLS